jgi:hypothetical protein
LLAYGGWTSPTISSLHLEIVGAPDQVGLLGAMAEEERLSIR